MSEREDEFNDNTEREDLNNQSDDNESYSYSDDSISSDDLTEESEVTSVTGTSSSSSSSLSAETSFSLSRGESPESTSKISNYQRQTHSSSNIGQTSSTGVGCTRRRNMSFSNMEMMRIERENQCLLRKIMAQQKQKKIIGFATEAVPVRLASSAINRKRMQRRIEEDNITILRKIQGAKSSSLSGKPVGVHESTSY